MASSTVLPRTSSVGIIVVHDFDENLDDAWIFKQKAGPIDVVSKRERDTEVGSIINPTNGDRAIENNSKSRGGMNESRASGTSTPKAAEFTPVAHSQSGRSVVPADNQTAGEITPSPGGDVDAQSETQTLENKSDTLSGKPVAIRNNLSKDPFNWLVDLGDRIPGTRVFEYRYPNFDPTKTSTSHYLNEVSSQLLQYMEKNRLGVAYNKVPLIFIGSGFGGLVIQKAITLVAKRTAGRSADKLPTDCNVDNGNGKAHQETTQPCMVAGIMLLDTPFPRVNRPDQRQIFPTNMNRRMNLIMQKRSDVEQLVDSVWKDFNKIQAESNIVWFHSQVRHVDRNRTSNAAPDRVEVSLTHPDNKTFPASTEFNISFVWIISQHARRISQFTNSKDRLYDQLVKQIQVKLLFMAVKRKDSFENEDKLVASLLSHGCEPNCRDGKGETPLHYAVRWKPKPEQVVLLLHYDANPCSRNKDGLMPLHIALQAAQDNDTTVNEDAKKSYKDSIRYLLQRSPDEAYSSKDLHEFENCKKCMGDQLVCMQDNKCWAKWIHDHLFIDSTTKDDQIKITEPTAKQTEVCKVYSGLLAEFYASIPEDWNGSVHNMIYDEENGLLKSFMLNQQKFKGSTPQCRWIHLPANNEQWIRDLFAYLGMQAPTLRNLRQKGEGKWQRQMEPGVLRLGFASVCGQGSEGSMLPKLECATKRNDYDTLVLTMPCLGFETYKRVKRMGAAIKNAMNTTLNAKCEHKELCLIESYLKAKYPIHCRRTLDQYRYHMLSPEELESRTQGQIIYKWATRDQGSHAESPDKAPILMVNQLWLCILSDGTVVSSLPSTSSPTEKYNTQTIMEQDLKSMREKRRDGLESPDALTFFILKRCVEFLGRRGPQHLSLEEAFQCSIDHILGKAAKLLGEFSATIKEADNSSDSNRRIEELADVLIETKELAEVMDILDELATIKSVLRVQQKVIKKLKKQTRIRNRSSNATSTKSPSSNKSTAVSPTSSPKFSGETVLDGTKLIVDILEIVADEINTINELETSAQNLSEQLGKLIQFKQQAASGFESRKANNLAEDTTELTRQGQRQNTIMLAFTFVTVIFLPLAFITSFLAIDVKEYPKDDKQENTAWPLSQVFAITFPPAILFFITVTMLAAKFGERLLNLLIPESSSSKSRRDLGKSRSKTPPDISPPSSGVMAETDDEEEYAPFAGVLPWCSAGPEFLRYPWKWQVYEDTEWDYPLRRGRQKLIGMSGLRNLRKRRTHPHNTESSAENHARSRSTYSMSSTGIPSHYRSSKTSLNNSSRFETLGVLEKGDESSKMRSRTRQG